MSAARGARPVTTGAKWRIATPETAAVRSAVIGPPSRIAAGAPVVGVIDDDDRADRRQPALVVRREPGHPFHADQVARTVRVGAAQIGRHGVHERVVRPRVDADLGRQLGIGDESGHGPLGQRQALVDVGHRREDVRRREVAERRRIGRRGP